MQWKGAVLLVVAFVAWCGWTGVAEGTEYVFYVNPANGTASGDGSANSPFLSVSEALEVQNATSADTLTIYLAPGDYTGPENVGLSYTAATLNLLGSGTAGQTKSAIDCQGTGVGMIVSSVGFTAANISITLCQTAVVAEEFALVTLQGVVVKDIPGTAVVMQDSYMFSCDSCDFSNVRNNSVSGSTYVFSLNRSTVTGPPGVGTIGGGVDAIVYINGSVNDSTFTDVVGLVGSSISTQALKLSGGVSYISGNLWDGCALRLNEDAPVSLAQQWTGKQEAADNLSASGGAVLLQPYDGLGSFSMANNSFVNCFSYGNGGALTLVNPTAVTMENFVLDGNRVEGSGGAIYITSGTNVTMTNVVLSFNSAEVDGGAIFMEDGSTAYLDNCIFSFNTAVVSGNDIACCSNSTSCTTSVYATNTTMLLDSDATTCTIESWVLTTDDSDDDDGSSLEWYDITLIILSAIGVVALLVGLVAFGVGFLLYKRQMRQAYEVVDD